MFHKATALWLLCVSILSSRVNADSQYVGCFADNEDRAMSYWLHKAGSGVNVALCIADCGHLGYTYAGLQNGNECFCGEDYDDLGPATNCHMDCGGVCGGGWANSVYKTDGTEFTPYPTPAPPPGYIGCFKDNGDRDIDFMLVRKNDLTLGECVIGCEREGFAYASLQNGNECFCGDAYGSLGPATNCNKVCGGSECGGSWANSVYEIEGHSFTPAPTPVGYLGCFRDNGERDMDYLLMRKNGLTAGECIVGCERGGYLYAGLQVGNECFCGHSYGSLGTAGNCDKTCEGVECGGTWANSIYQTDVAEFTPPPTPEGYLGCWRDNGERDMDFLLERSDSVTVDSCLSGCKGLGYIYAGLQYGIECFCGNEYGSLGPAGNCDRDCSGECGGRWANSIFEAGGDGNVLFSQAAAETQCLATGWGDPHIVTFDGLKYDVHTLGEMTFLKSRNTNFEIQARLEAVPRNGNPAVTTGVVVREADDSLPRIQVSLSESSSPNAVHVRDHCYVQLYVDGTPRDITTGTGTSGANVGIFNTLIIVEYPSTKLRLDMEVVVWSNTCHFTTDYILLDCRDGDDLVGILGTPDGNKDNDWMKRDGTEVPIPDGVESFFFKPAYDYATNWCIPTAEESYFSYEPNTEFSTFDFCENPYDPTLEETIQQALLDENDEFTNLCAGEIGCMIDGEGLGLHAATAALQEPANLNPPNEGGANPAGSQGDPHFKTWKQEHYEYHGQCDMILVQDSEFAGGLGLQVQIRTKLVRFWSYIKSAAIRIGDDILEIEGGIRDDDSVTNYWMNLQYQGKLDSVGGFPVTLKIPKEDKRVFTIDLSSKYRGQKIVISTYKEFVKVDFENGTKESYGRTVGLLGNFHTGQTLARDGLTVLEDFNSLGNEWQVLPSEDMLFHDVAAPQFPAKCIEPEDPQGQRRRRRLDETSVSVEEAEKACGTVKDALDRKDCVYDVLATQDLDMVGAF